MLIQVKGIYGLCPSLNCSKRVFLPYVLLAVLLTADLLYWWVIISFAATSEIDPPLLNFRHYFHCVLSQPLGHLFSMRPSGQCETQGRALKLNVWLLTRFMLCSLVAVVSLATFFGEWINSWMSLLNHTAQYPIKIVRTPHLRTLSKLNFKTALKHAGCDGDPLQQHY